MFVSSQIRSQFLPNLWKQGQALFNTQKVQGVERIGPRVQAKVQDTRGHLLPVSVKPVRGGMVIDLKCSCSNSHRLAGKCEHIAALCNWLINKGSLLALKADQAADSTSLPIVKVADSVRDRSADQEEPSTDLEEAEIITNDQPPVEDEVVEEAPRSARAVVAIKGFFLQGVLKSISIEPSLVFLSFDESDSFLRDEMPAFEEKVMPTSRLSRTDDPKIWRIPGTFHRLMADKVELPIVQSLFGNPLVFQGAELVDHLALALKSIPQAYLYLDASIKVSLDTNPLKLKKVRLGERNEVGRKVYYEYGNEEIFLDSNALTLLSKNGKLGFKYAWFNEKLLKLEPSLDHVLSRLSRSGLASLDIGGKKRSTKKRKKPDSDSGIDDGWMYFGDDADEDDWTRFKIRTISLGKAEPRRH